MRTWIAPRYQSGEIDKAGEILKRHPHQVPIDELSQAYTILDNFRSAHAFPLNTFQMGLRRRASEVDTDSLVAQRIKRLSSIEAKLRRFPTLRLSQMQDIGGCRAVLGSVSKVDELVRRWEASRIRHIPVGRKDYIRQPDKSGYRGIHLVYRYESGRNKVFNGTKVEMQLRTNLQHIWATAVETVGTFTRQALKSSIGRQDWLRFFALMGTEIAWKEDAAPVPGTPIDREELGGEIRELAARLNVEKMLDLYAAVIEASSGVELGRARYFLLTLTAGPEAGSVTVKGFRSTAFDQASAEYLEEEKAISEGRSAGQAVLVSVDSFDALTKAYPNYFLDTHAFLDEVRQAVS